MNIVKVENRRISGEVVQTVNARDLYEWLEVGRDFSTWIKGRIEEYSFVEGEDFTPISGKSIGGRPSIEYHLTINMAKELAMVERNEKGREVRKYFIDIERQYRRKQSPEWQRARKENKLSRKAETDVIEEFVKYATAQGSSNARHYYSNITKGTYKALYLLEKSAEIKNLRERLSVMQLNQLATAEGIARKAIAEYMDLGTHYKDIYKVAIDRVITLADLLGKQLPGNDNVQRLR